MNMNQVKVRIATRSGLDSTVTLPNGTICDGCLCRRTLALLFVGTATLAPILCPPAARADVTITATNPGASIPGGTAGTIYYSDLVIRLTNGRADIKRTFSPPIPINSLSRNPSSSMTIPGINLDDIAGVSFSSRLRMNNGMFGPERVAPGLTEGRRVQLAYLPTLGDPLGNPLVVVTDFGMYQNPPSPGTVLNFTNGLDPALPDWFVATSFDENTFVASGPYTGSATVANPVLGVQISQVPEPSALGTTLCGTMAGAVWLLRRRRKRHQA